MARTIIKAKRAYDAPDKDDGVRVLVDRLWPRGVTKEELKFDLWPKEITPSNELRKWYHHDMDAFAEFRQRYRAELAQEKGKVDELRAAIKGKTATLITAAKDIERSHVVVLREVLEK